MTNIDAMFVRVGLLFLLAGMAFGIWMGINDQLQFSNFHAHVNLVGFVVSMLFGLAHRAWPALRQSRLAVPQFWLHVVGALLLVAGKYQVTIDPSQQLLVATGSLVVLLATLLFAVMFFKRAGN